MSAHLSAESLERLVGSTVSAAELADADRHLMTCTPCREKLAARLPSGAGLLAAVRGEARRHLTFEELEQCLAHEGSLDELLARHLAACASCSRELDDLRAFDELKGAAAPLVTSAADRHLVTQGWWRRFLIMGAGAAVILVAALVVAPPWGQPLPVEATVHLAEQRTTALDRPRTLRREGAAALPSDVVLAIGRAREEARASGTPRTLTVTVSRAAYDGIMEELAAVGSVDVGARVPMAAAAEAAPIALSITFVPPPYAPPPAR